MTEDLDVQQVELTASERDALLKAALALPPGIYEDSFQTRAAVLKAIEENMLPILGNTPLGESLRRMKEGTLLSVVARNVPTDPGLPAPPLDGGRPEGKETFVSEGMALAMAKLMGEPTPLIGEKDEAIVHQITPVPGREGTQSNEGTVDLKLHQDLAPNPCMPSLRYDIGMPEELILTGIQRGAGETETYLTSVDRALESLSPRSQAILREKRFVTNPPDSFIKKYGEDFRYPPMHAVLFDHAGHTEMSFDTSSQVRPADPKDAEGYLALAELEAALSECGFQQS